MLILDCSKIEIAQARVSIPSTVLTKKANLCTKTLYNLKKGKPCKPETVYRIAKALNVDPAELIKKE